MTNTVSRVISDETLSRGIQIESAGRAGARASTSSASGLAQFISATWLATVRKHRPDWFTGRSDAQVLALRFEPARAIEMMARLWEDNARLLGVGYSDGDLYLAHFAGAATARRLVQADPSASCANVFSAAAIAANRSILAGKSCGEVRAWAARKMAQAGGRDWIGVHLHGAKPPPVRARKQIVAGATVGAATTIAIGAQQNASLWPWIVAGLAAIAAAMIAYVIWRKSRVLAPTHVELTGESHGVG